MFLMESRMDLVVEMRIWVAMLKALFRSARFPVMTLTPWEVTVDEEVA